MKIYPPTTAYEDGIVLLQPWPYYLNGKPHTGIDIYSQVYRGHKPRATEDGKVVDVIAGSGKKVSCVTIEVETTADRLEYKHVTASVKVGDKVVAGQIIGKFDESGKDIGLWQGYHLHFGVRECPTYEVQSDPVIYLLHAEPNLIFYMRKDVHDVYKKKEYYDLMQIKPIPWEA